MSHQTGITASESLRHVFGSCNNGKVRLMKIAIENESLVLAESVAPRGTWEQDWDTSLESLLEEHQPCYILYRLDTANATGYQWIYMSYSPDTSSVKQKMLYAATRSTLKMDFGSGQIKDELFGTLAHEISLRGYQKYVQSQQAPAPLTAAEEELKLVKKQELHTDIHVDTKRQTMAGVAFPIASDAIEKLKELNEGRITYVQLRIDIKNEIVKLANFDNIDADQLGDKVPREEARYHFFRFKHSHEGDYLESIVFIYSMPGYTCSIKERMLYSSCKAPLLETVEQHLAMDLVRKLEVDDPNEITKQFIYEEVHPKKTIIRNKFDRPAGPRGRGPKRLTKLNPTE